MSSIQCSDICEMAENLLRQAGFDIPSDEDHQPMRDALLKATLLKDENVPVVVVHTTYLEPYDDSVEHVALEVQVSFEVSRFLPEAGEHQVQTTALIYGEPAAKIKRAAVQKMIDLGKAYAAEKNYRFKCEVDLENYDE